MRCETRRVRSCIGTAVGNVEQVQLLVAERGTNRIKILRDVARPVAARGSPKLLTALQRRGQDRARSVLEIGTVDRGRAAAATIVDEEQVVSIEISPD